MSVPKIVEKLQAKVSKSGDTMTGALSGGNNGTANGDNCNFGTLLLFPMASISGTTNYQKFYRLWVFGSGGNIGAQYTYSPS